MTDSKRFLPKVSGSGVLSSDEDPPKGYSATSIEYNIRTETRNCRCRKVILTLTLTGYPTVSMDTEKCTLESVLELIDRIYHQMVMKYRGSTPAEQAGIEDRLKDTLKARFPTLISNLLEQ